MLKKLLIGLVLLLVLAIGTVLIAPTFIDWNSYKQQIAAEVEAMTGRTVTIDGDLSLAVLPSPALSAEGLRLGNLPGGSQANMVTVDAVRINLQIAPLLSGVVVFDSVVLDAPDILLERLADGRENWVFAADAAQGGGSIPAPEQGESVTDPAPTQTPAPQADGSGPNAEAAGGFDVSIGAVRIEGGRVVYIDQQSGTREVVEDIEINVSADSLRGPFRLSGSVVARAIPMVLEGAVGTLEEGKASQVSVGVSIPEGDAQVTFKGLLSDFDGGMAGRGTLDIAVGSPSATIATVAQALELSMDALPAALSQPLSISGRLEATQTGIRWDDLTGDVAGTTIAGSIAAQFAPETTPEVDIGLTLGRVDGESWMAAQALPLPDGSGATAIRQFAEALTAIIVSEARAQTGEPVLTPAPDASGAFVLPTGIDVSVDLSVDALLWNGDAIRDVVASLRLSDGEMTVNQFSAQMPGVSDISLFGLVLPGQAGAEADLSVELQSQNFRDLLGWVGADLTSVPADRLRILSVRGGLIGNATQLQLTNVTAQFDTTTVQAAATVRMGERIGLGVSLIVDALNLDAYQVTDPAASAPAPDTAPTDAVADQTTAAPSADSAPTEESAPAGSSDPEAPLLAGLGALNDLDASFDVQIGRLIAQDIEVQSVVAQGSLVSGQLNLTQLGFADALGARVSLTGGLSGFGAHPQFDGLGYSVAAQSLERIAFQFDLDLPVPAEQIGAVALQGTLSGPIDQLTVSGQSQAAGASVSHSGTIANLLSDAMSASLAVDLSHPDAVQAIRLVQPGYTPAGGGIGALAFQGTVATQPGQVDISGMRLVLGSNDVNGTVQMKTGGAVPEITADLTSNNLNVDALLPAEQAASLGPAPEPGAAGQAIRKAYGVPDSAHPLLQLASMTVARPEGRDTAHPALVEAALGEWTTTPIDLSALDTAQANIALKAGTLTVQGLPVRQADVAATLQNSVLDVSRLNGSLYGGALNGTARVAGGGAPSYALNMQLQNWLVSELLGVGAALGDGTVGVNVNSAGLSMLDIVRALSGDGGLNINGLDVSLGGDGAVRGNMLAGLIGVMANLNQVTSFGQGGALADLSGGFSIQNGILDFNPFEIVSQFYNATMAGRINLVDWSLDANGTANLVGSAIGSLLGNAVNLPDNLPFSVSGPLNNPNITVATLPRPDELRPENIPQVLEQVVPGLLGGGNDGGSEQPAAPIEVPKEAEQLLRGLFGR